MSGTPNRRPSLAAVSPAVSGRRLSSGGITPNVATPSVDNAESRRGSLRDLPTERDAFGAALRQYDRDLKSGKLSHCAYPAIRTQLLNTTLGDLPRAVPTDKPLVLFDGTTDPVQAFDELIDAGLEAVPVTSSQHHVHQADGMIVVNSSHQQFPALYKAIKEKEQQLENATPTSQFFSDSTPATSTTPTSSPVLKGNSGGLPSPKLSSAAFTTPAKQLLHEQCIIIDPLNNTQTMVASSSLPPSYHPVSFSSFSSASTLSASPSALRDSLNLSSSIQQEKSSPLCPVDCPFRQAAGWFDIRDLASCIVYVYQQPINEDLLEFREGGHVEAPLVLNTRGLDGITDLPTLTGSSSFSSINSDGSCSPSPQSGDSSPSIATTPINTSTLHPSLPEETIQHNDYMGVVYENDEAKSQGLQIKEHNATVAKFQGGFSHRLSLAPMAEEDDGFDMNSISAIVEDEPLAPSTPKADQIMAPEPSIVPSLSASPSISSSTREVSRSRSQSRHRRKLVTADELSADLTAGDQEAWMATLKQGLGKFSVVGNISTSYLSRRHPVRSVKAESSLYDVCKLLSIPNSHRVAVIDSNNSKIVDIISHRSIIKWFYKNKDTFFTLNQTNDSNTITDGDETSDVEMQQDTSVKSLLDKYVDDLNIGTRNLNQVRNDILGLDALQEIDEHNRTGLAVVDDCGRLVGATSTRTIKRITANRDHKTLSQPLLQFIEEPDLELNPEDNEDENCMVSHGAVVLLDENVTLGQILSAMYKHNSNRVFLVTDESYPTKVISFSDVLQLILY